MNRYNSIIFFFSMLTIFSCDKSETIENGGIYGKWAATGFMSIESVAYPKKDGFSPVIEIKTDGSYFLKLDMNSCMGSFTLSNGNGISISASGCTKICCNSQFSQKLTEILSRVKIWSIEDKMLKLNIPNWGWIELEKEK